MPGSYDVSLVMLTGGQCSAVNTGQADGGFPAMIT
jgi:hypothetical protein